jgi:hypothetical protein
MRAVAEFRPDVIALQARQHQASLMTGYGILFVPRSWAFGRWDVRTVPYLPYPSPPKKTLWAFGPLRFVRHYGLGPWKDGCR